MGFGMQWHQLDHMQTICTSIQTDNHTNTWSLNFYGPDALSDAKFHQCQSTEGITITILLLQVYGYKAFRCDSSIVPTTSTVCTSMSSHQAV